jgi:hypothetical protein
VTILAQDPPAASALKMAYASYQKATRALAAVAHALVHAASTGMAVCLMWSRVSRITVTSSMGKMRSGPVGA